MPSPFVQNWAFAAHKVDLVNGAKKKKHSAGRQVESNCPFAYIELWEKVQLPMQSIHQQTCSMSSNMPEHAQQGLYATMCGSYSYHYSDHMQTIHPGQKLTEEEAAKYAIHKEEYL